MDVRWIALAATVCAVLLLMGVMLRRRRKSGLHRAANALLALAAVPVLGVVLAFATKEILCYWLALALTAGLFVFWFLHYVLKNR